MNTETLQTRAARLVQNEVLCCVSSLVHTLATNCAYVTCNSDADRDMCNLAEQAQELAFPIDDWEEAARDAGWIPEIEHNGEDDGVRSADRENWAEDWRGACEQDGLEPYQREVFEHWAVSTWLADKLIERGEKVDTGFAGLNVWARTTTGQAISIDHVIEEITRELHA